MTATTRPYLFTVRPAHRETVASYSTRLLQANYETPAHQTHLINAHTSSAGKADKEVAWRQIVSAKTGRTLHLTEHPTSWVNHPDGSSCTACHDGLPTRIMCTLCAHSDTIEQNPHFDNIVCIRHSRWIGLTTPATGQHPVGASTVKAAHRFRRLRRAGRLDLRLFTTLSTGIRRAHTPNALTGSASESLSEPDLFELTVHLADTLTSRTFAETFYNPGSPFADTHQHLDTTVRHLLGAEADSDPLIRILWIYARPTVWAIRHSIITGTPFSYSGQHDLHLPRAVANRIITAGRPTEPFINYLQVTTDHHLSTAHLDRLVNRAAPATKSAEAPRRRVGTICAAGHAFDAPVSTDNDLRFGRAPSCPGCNLRLVIPGYNDLATTHPDVAADFDRTRNNGVTAADIIATSDKYYFWTCATGHSYTATASARSHGDDGCPVCLGRVIQIGVNDLAATHPHIAAEWHPGWTSHLSPTTVTATNTAYATWLCAEGHVYEMRINERVGRKTCPTCARAATRGQAFSLTATHPELAAEWHPFYNGIVRAEEFTHESAETVTWLCPKGHHYRQRIEQRAAGYQCSVCSRPTLVPGVNDLATTQPLSGPGMAQLPQHQTSQRSHRRNRAALVEVPRGRPQNSTECPDPHQIKRLCRLRTRRSNASLGEQLKAVAGARTWHELRLPEGSRVTRPEVQVHPSVKLSRNFGEMA